MEIVKLFVWTMNDYNKMVLIFEEDNYNASGIYTTDENLCKQLIQKYPESSFRSITIDEIVKITSEDIYDDSTLINSMIDVEGKVFKYIEEEGVINKDGHNVNFIPLEDMDKYKQKCCECNTLIHEDIVNLVWDDEGNVYCCNCQDDSIYYFCEECQDLHRYDKKECVTHEWHDKEIDKYCYICVCSEKDKIRQDFLNEVKNVFSKDIYSIMYSMLNEEDSNTLSDAKEELKKRIIDII